MMPPPADLAPKSFEVASRLAFIERIQTILWASVVILGDDNSMRLIFRKYPLHEGGNQCRAGRYAGRDEQVALLAVHSGCDAKDGVRRGRHSSSPAAFSIIIETMYTETPMIMEPTTA